MSLFNGYLKGFLMMKKKILAVCISLLLVSGLLSACSDDDSSSKKSSSDSLVTSSSDTTSETTEEEATEPPDPSLTLNGKEVDTKGLVLCTVDGNDIGFDEYRYNYYYFISNYGANLGVTDEDMSKLSEDEKKERFETLKTNIMSFIKTSYVYSKYAKENGISLTDDEKKKCDEEIEKIKEEQKDKYSDYLKQLYLTEDYFKKIVQQSKLAQKVQDSFKLTDDEFLDTAEDKLVLVKHILIPFGYDITPDADMLNSMGVTNFSSMTRAQKMSILPTAYASLSEDEQKKEKDKAKKYAADILKKAQDGENFDSLINEYGYDGGMTEYSGGYLVGDFYTTYEENFTKASVALKQNEISDLVETGYGYHIIKRVPFDREYIKKNIEDEDSGNTFKDEYVSAFEFNTLDKLLATIKVEESDILKNLQYGDLK